MDLMRIINFDLTKLNLTYQIVQNELLGDIALIIPKNLVVDEPLKETKYKNIRPFLVEYMSKHNEGNIQKKENLLSSIDKEIEGITKNPKYKGLNDTLFDDTDFLYNNLNLRHNQEVKDVRFYNKTIANREEWLDLVYRNSILVLSCTKEYDDHLKIKSLKKEVDGGSI